MARYPRTPEGHASAVKDAARMARRHPDKKYGLYVDIRHPDQYGTSLASLIRPENVEPGTAAILVDAEGHVSRMFQDDPDPSP